MPRWVKICGIAEMLLIVVVLLIRGEHSPGRHLHGAAPRTVAGVAVANAGHFWGVGR
ncbi:hypothetical protein [Streptomyces sp. NPDC000410]|uniref:hypothetical protein n=1 Tax=Streptomyces sp. NPDC000410 TaxID=3154254 RepID=UPI003326C3B4